MTFKIKDGVAIGTTNIFNNSGQQLAPVVIGSAEYTPTATTQDGIKISGRAGGSNSYRVELIPTTLSANRTITLPNATGTLALTSDIPTVNNGTFAVSIGSAAASGTAVAWGTTTGFSANTSSNATYDLRIGPALTALATLMSTAGAGFIRRGATADTYTIDTNTYLTSYTETDTLATVTGRGASTSTNITLSGGTTNLGNATTNLITTSDNGTIVLSTKDQTTRQSSLLQFKTGNTTAVGSFTGAIAIFTGNATGGSNAYAGDIDIYAGSSDGVGANTRIYAGDSASGTTSTGGNLTLRGGQSTTTSATTANGGNVYIYGGSINSSNNFTKNSGSIYIDGGGASGSGTITYGTINLGTQASSSSNGTSAINIGTSANTTTINGTVKLPNVGTSGFVKLGTGGQLSQDTNTYLTSYTETDTLQTVTGRGASSSVATITLSANTASTTTGTGTLVVTGGVGIGGALNVGGAGSIGGNLTITGNLIVNGTTTTVNSTTTTLDDPIITLGGDTAPSTDDNKDRGVEFRWHNGTTAKIGFFGFDDSTGKFTFIPDATNSSEVFAGTKGEIDATVDWSNIAGDTTVGSNLVTLTNPSAVSFIRINADNTVTALSDVNFRTAIGAGTGNGTVTSVSGTTNVVAVATGTTTPVISLIAGHGDTTNPYGSKTANHFLAAPNGSAGAPTFRAIVAADIPTLNQNTTGTAANVTGTVAIANGGTGQTTQTAAFDALSPTTTKGDLIVDNGTNAVRLPVGATNGHVLTVDSAEATGVKWAAVATASTPTLQQVTGQGATSTNSIQLNNAELILAPSTTARIYKRAVQPNTITTVNATTIDSWATATYRSAKYTIQIVQGSKFQLSEVYFTHNDTNVYLTEYAVVENSSIPATISASIASGTLSLQVTITDANTTNATVTMERTLFAI